MAMVSVQNRGFTLVELVIVLAIMGTLAGIGAQVQNRAIQNEYISVAQADLAELNQAYNQFYYKQRRAPNTIAELQTEGYYTGALQTPWGAAYEGAEIPDRGYRFSVEAQTDGRANGLVKELRGGQINGTEVSFAVPLPSLESIQSQFLHRQLIAGRPELNMLETDLDGNENSLLNFNEIVAIEGEFTEVEVLTSNIDVLITEGEIQVGSNIIRNNDGVIEIDAETVSVLGDLQIEGDLVGTGTNNITGFNEITVNSVVALEADIDELFAQTGEFENLNATEAEFTSLTGETLEFVSATGESVTADEGDIRNLIAETVIFQDGTFTNLAATQAIFESASGTTIGFSDGTITTLSGSTLDYVSGDFGSVSVTGQTTTTNLQVSGLLTAVNAVFTSLEVTGSLTGAKLEFDVIDANTINVGEFNVMNLLTAPEADINGLLTSDSIDVVNDVTVDGSTTTTDLTVNGTAELGSVTANDVDVTGTLGAASAVFDGQVSADSLQGGTFTGDDFITFDGNSVNGNASNIAALRAVWDACVLRGGCQ